MRGLEPRAQPCHDYSRAFWARSDRVRGHEPEWFEIRRTRARVHLNQSGLYLLPLRSSKRFNSSTNGTCRWCSAWWAMYLLTDAQ